MSKVKWGWEVICLFDDQASEVEGIVFLDGELQVGEGIILSDGKLWQVARISSELLTLWVKQPESRY